eukprot:854747-Pleurochrysis_carterae.AAC.4
MAAGLTAAAAEIAVAAVAVEVAMRIVTAQTMTCAAACMHRSSRMSLMCTRYFDSRSIFLVCSRRHLAFTSWLNIENRMPMSDPALSRRGVLEPNVSRLRCFADVFKF